MLKERSRCALKDADVMPETFKDGGIEEAAERASNLQVLILKSKIKRNGRGGYSLKHIAYASYC